MIENKNGFTLVELLATLAILSIIMMIAVPNVMSILDKNKRTTYLEDAKKLVTQADYKFRKDQSIPKPEEGECVVFRMKNLDVSEIKKGPEGSLYDTMNSFVAIKYEGEKYLYGVMLLETNSKKRGVGFVESKLLTDEGAMMKYVKENLGVIPLAVNGNISGTGFNCKVQSIH